jgi:hypothetical protein
MNRRKGQRGKASANIDEHVEMRLELSKVLKHLLDALE